MILNNIQKAENKVGQTKTFQCNDIVRPKETRDEPTVAPYGVMGPKQQTKM